jgi:Transposase IS66 family/RNase_H superfamily
MQPTLPILRAMLPCPYKAWQLAREAAPVELTIPLHPKTTSKPERLVTLAWSLEQGETLPSSTDHRSVLKFAKEAEALLAKTKACIGSDTPPPFFQIAHCSECQFKESCYKKLKEKDCISLLPGMTPTVVAKYHKKGITTITQLSHLFRPRRSGRVPQRSVRYLVELKALAIREQKTFVVQPPDVSPHPVSIYLDFEGLPDEKFQYLLGGIAIADGSPPESFSFWCDRARQEGERFKKLFTLLSRYPDAPIYHYGAYESKALKRAAEQWVHDFNEAWPPIEKRMVNLLGYLRTHVYPPTYGNGLKEVARFLGFEWTEADASGVRSMEWRLQWELTGSPSWKEKLLQYNQDDCRALMNVREWLSDLALGDQSDNLQKENVQLVSQMKKHSPYRLRANVEFGEDFQVINKAAYFNYQRDKIYWRKQPKSQTPPTARKQKPKHRKGGVRIWQPKKINQVVVLPALEKCRRCGSTRIYHFAKWKASTIQTDLKFTVSGIRRHVIQYQSPISECRDCDTRMTHRKSRWGYGPHLFALVIYYHVNYHLSNEMIAKLIQEQYGVKIGRTYLITAKNKWWNKTWGTDAEYIREIVLHSPVIHIDETSIPLKGQSGYVWVFATTHSVFYHYTPTRNTDFLRDLLKDYKGVVVSDFYPGYETLDVTRQKCLIHLIRDLNDDLFKVPYDEEYRLLVSAFGTLLRGIIETIDRHGLQKVHLERHTADVELFYRAFVEGDHTSELSVRYSKRLKKHWDELWIFLHHDDVPWNNNNAEVGIKAFAQHRHGVKGMMREQGLREYLQMLTVAQTCRYRNLSFLDYLRGKCGIWENVSPLALPGYLSFKQARLYVRSLQFKLKAQWNDWKKSEKRPSFIPDNPEKFYRKQGWVSWDDWLRSKV